MESNTTKCHTVRLDGDTRIWQVDTFDFRVVNTRWIPGVFPAIRLVGFLREPDKTQECAYHAKVLRTDPGVVEGLYPLFSDGDLFVEVQPVRCVSLES